MTGDNMLSIMLRLSRFSSWRQRGRMLARGLMGCFPLGWAFWGAWCVFPGFHVANGAALPAGIGWSAGTPAMNAFAGQAVDVPMPVAFVMAQVFMYTIVPIWLGMLVRRFAPGFATRIGPACDRFAALAFLFILIAILCNARADILAMAATVGGVTAVLALVMSALGLALGALMAVGPRRTVTPGIEVGIQNTVLGMVAAGSVLDGMRGLEGAVMCMPSAVHGVIMFLPALGIIACGRRKFAPMAGGSAAVQASAS